MKLRQQKNQQSPQSYQKINLKEMLNYYKDRQTPAISEDFINSPLYKYDDIQTEEVKLPHSKYQHFACISHQNSQQLRKHSPINFQCGDTFLNVRCTDQTCDGKSKSKSKLTRESISVMNKKYRNIRTSHYRANSEKNQQTLSRGYEKQFKENDKMIIKKIQRSYSGALSRKATARSSTLRPSSNMMDRKTSVCDRIQSAQGFQTRSRMSSSVKKKIDDIVELKNNPLVIYPFQSKFKVKRIDDNPKILTNIIIKKSKHLSKQQLYEYINSLISRRDK